jgi:hypothetical protein
MRYSAATIGCILILCMSNACSCVKDDSNAYELDAANVRAMRRPVPIMVSASKHDGDTLRVSWVVKNPYPVAMRIAGRWDSQEPSWQPATFVLPSSTLLCALGEVKFPEEQLGDDSWGGITPPNEQFSVSWVTLDPNEQYKGEFTLSLPLRLSSVGRGDPDSVFDHRGGYGHLDGIFHPTAEDEVQRCVAVLSQLVMAVQYELYMPASGEEGACSEQQLQMLMRDSFIRQAVRARKWPGARYDPGLTGWAISPDIKVSIKLATPRVVQYVPWGEKQE